MKKDFLTGQNYISFSGELHWPVRHAIQTDLLLGMLAPIIDVDQFSAEIFADLGHPLNRFRIFKLTHWNPITQCKEGDRKRLNSHRHHMRISPFCP
jgi:hypothetical protein